MEELREEGVFKEQYRCLPSVVMMNDFIKNDLIPEDDGQVASGSVSLPDPVVFETVEQTLEKE